MQILEEIIEVHAFNTFKVEYQVTFIVTSFENFIMYWCLLGKPFFRANQLVKDFGSDLLYMKKETQLYQSGHVDT